MKPLENENSRDWLLFQYVEGELDEAQVQQLETQLTSDEALREELTLWEEAFVENKTYDTSALETKLRITDTSSWIYFRTGIGMLVVLLIASFSFPKFIQSQKQYITISVPVKKTIEPSLSTTTNAMPIQLVTDLPARKKNLNPQQMLPKNEPVDTQPLHAKHAGDEFVAVPDSDQTRFGRTGNLPLAGKNRETNCQSSTQKTYPTGATATDPTERKSPATTPGQRVYERQ